VDAKTAKLRAEDTIRRTELLRDLTSRKSFRISADLPVITEPVYIPEMTVGYTTGRTKVRSVRHDSPTSRGFVQKVFARSRADLYKRLVRAFESDCGCGCGGECQ
jgi:hypothetical protein